MDGFRWGMDDSILGRTHCSHYLGIMKLNRRNYSTPKHDPLNVAKARYATGEIPIEEFNQTKEDLA